MVIRVHAFGSPADTIDSTLLLLGEVVDLATNPTLDRGSFEILWGKPGVIDNDTFTNLTYVDTTVIKEGAVFVFVIKTPVRFDLSDDRVE
jgi:hypothetical protein